MEPWAELVELYEYKVADFLAGRDPRGGRRSLVALRDTLMHGALDSALMRRFRHADRLWREYTVAVAPPEAPAPTPHTGAFEDWNVPSAAPLDAEAEQLALLARGLWRVRLDDQLAKLVARWRREPGLVTLRALYALSLNLDAGKVTHDVPDERDPLVSLDNPEIALGVVGALIDQLLQHQSDTVTSVEWARPVMLALAANPFAQSNRAMLNQPDHLMRQAAARATERAQVREALGRGFDALVSLLPPKLGGSGPEFPSVARVLFARESQRRLEEPDGGTTLAIRLAGSGEVRWHGQVIGWQSLGREWQLTAGGAAYTLRQGENGTSVTRIPLDGVELRALRQGEYILLDLEHGEHASLGALIALGRPVGALLDPSDDYLHLRLARGVAQWLRDGRFDRAALSADSGAKYASAAQDSLLSFARKGAENLLARLARQPEEVLARAFREVAHGIGCEERRAQRVLDLLRHARTEANLSEVAEVRGEHEMALVAYRGEPVTVKVAGRALTLRADYRGEVTAVLPGAPALPVRDLQVFALPHGAVLIARQGLRLAVAYQGAVTTSAAFTVDE